MVADVVLELTGVIRLAKADFADGKPKTVPDIRGRLCTWGRTKVHQDAHELNRNRATAEAGGYIAARAVVYHSPRKHSPIIGPFYMHMHRAGSNATLHRQARSVADKSQVPDRLTASRRCSCRTTFARIRRAHGRRRRRRGFV